MQVLTAYREHRTNSPAQKSTTGLPVSRAAQRDSEQSLDELDKYWNNIHDGWR